MAGVVLGLYIVGTVFARTDVERLNLEVYEYEDMVASVRLRSPSTGR